MKQIAFGISTFFLLAFLGTGSVLATDSAFRTATSYTDVNTAWTSPSSAQAVDGNSATCSGPSTGAGVCQLQLTNYGDFSIPSGSTITTIHVKIHAAGSPAVAWALQPSGGGSGGCPYNATRSQTFSSSTTLGEYDIDFNNSSDCSSWFTPSIANTNGFLFSTARGSVSTSTYKYDGVEVGFTYDLPHASVVLDSATASPSGQLITLDLHGDTSTTSALTKCDVSGFEKVAISGQATSISSVPIFHIILDATNPQSITKNLGGGYYLGYGFDSTHSTFTANGITVPYHDTGTITYPLHVSCTVQSCTVSSITGHNICSDIVSTGEWDYSSHSDLILTPSGTINNQALPTCNTFEAICWLGDRIGKLLDGFFGLHQDAISQQLYQDLQTNLKSRVPFAYIYPVLNLDFQEATPSSSSPSIVLPITLADSSVGVNNYTWTAPTEFTSAWNSIRDAVSIALWLAFIAYIITRAGSIF